MTGCRPRPLGMNVSVTDRRSPDRSNGEHFFKVLDPLHYSDDHTNIDDKNPPCLDERHPLDEARVVECGELPRALTPGWFKAGANRPASFTPAFRG